MSETCQAEDYKLLVILPGTTYAGRRARRAYLHPVPASRAQNMVAQGVARWPWRHESGRDGDPVQPDRQPQRRGDHNALLRWFADSRPNPPTDVYCPYEPGFFIGCEREDGAHQRGGEGWPFSIYRRARKPGAIDAVLAHGIQHPGDAELLCKMCNEAEGVERSLVDAWK